MQRYFKIFNPPRENAFSLPEIVPDKKIRVDFDSPDISSNGGLVLIGNMHNSLAWQIGQLIPDSRKKEFIHHTYMEMVSQRIGQILCGYEDANDCNQLRDAKGISSIVVFIQLWNSTQGRANCRHRGGQDSLSCGILLSASEQRSGLPTTVLPFQRR